MGSTGTKWSSDVSARSHGSAVTRRGGSSRLFNGRKLISSRIIARHSASSRAMKWATPLVALWVIAPPRSCLVTDRKSTRLNSSHRCISYAVFCLKKKNELVERKVERHAEGQR